MITDTLKYFREVLDPKTCRGTPQSAKIREPNFEMESRILDFASENSSNRTLDYEDLISYCGDVSCKAKEGIEIVEEDHGKLLFVFTSVTIIFLPLSFVSSLFGMNTADVRNMGQSQWLFWAISIPVTGFVVFVAILLAYKDHMIVDALSAFWKVIMREHRARRDSVVARSSSLRVDEVRDEEAITKRRKKKRTLF